jgi:prepilin-type N-terminal cleavage/methylation domain-containing protein
MFWVSRDAQHGFTLTELLITMAISGVIMGAIVSTFIVQRRSYAMQEQITEMVQNVRTAMDMMVREVRMAGYGVPKSQLSTWVDWVEGFTSNPHVTAQDSKPVKLSFATCFEVAQLSEAASAGTTTLKLNLDSDGMKKFVDDAGKVKKAKKVLYIGRNENAVIIEASASDKKLTIDTDPTTKDTLEGLRWSYPIGTPVELLAVITYDIEIVKEGGKERVARTTLRRDENTGGGAQPLAENIENLQVTLAGNALTLSLTGRTTREDPSYTHPTKNDDHYRRLDLSSRVRLRNLGL